jgi:hypothetical protein
MILVARAGSPADWFRRGICSADGGAGVNKVWSNDTELPADACHGPERGWGGQLTLSSGGQGATPALPGLSGAGNKTAPE